MAGNGEVFVRHMRAWEWLALYALYRRGSVELDARLPAAGATNHDTTGMLQIWSAFARLQAVRKRAQYGIFRGARRLPVGTVMIQGTTIDRCGEVGYWIGRPFWGQGLATLAVREVVAEAFERSEVDSLIARTSATNHASRRVLEKCGFRAQGGAPDERASENVVTFCLSAAEWRRGQEKRPLA